MRGQTPVESENPRLPDAIAQRPLIWRGEFKVHSYDVDFKKGATMESLCRHFQEAAWNHAEDLGVGYQRLLAANRIWVLSRLLLKVEQLPRWGETVTICTWPRAARSVFAMRDFEMFDSAGVRLVAGTSAWLVLDTNTHKPQRVDKIVSAITSLPTKRALDEEPGKLAGCLAGPQSAGTQGQLVGGVGTARPQAGSSKRELAGDEPSPPLPAAPLGSAIASVTVRYSDIDVNGHVNNSRYVGWIMDSYPVEYHRNHSVFSLEANYLGETIGGDAITILSKEAGPCEYWHSVVKAGGGEVCRARVKWVNC